MEHNNREGYLTIEPEENNINYYIEKFSEFNEILKALLRKQPETREALLGASYKDVLALRVLASDAGAYLRELEQGRALQATSSEALDAAAGNPNIYSFEREGRGL